MRSGPGSHSREERDGRGRAPPRNSRIQVRNEQKVITHLREARADHTRYSAHNCKCVAGNRTPLRPFGRGKRVETVRLNHLRAALLAVAAAGLLSAVGLLVVVLYAQPAEANFPGKPGKIAFAGRDAPNGDFELYTINPNGGGKKQLTNNSTNDIEPAYSPNGKKIAYQGYDGQDAEIYTINANGGGKKQLTDNSSSDREPSYSPSGKKIAFQGYDGQDTEIYTINAGGGGKQPVTDNSSDDYFPDYAPNGTRIAYTNNAETGTDEEIYTIKPDGGGKKQLTDNTANDYYPSYSPSGKKIAYVYEAAGTDAEIYTIKPSGGGRTTVADNSTNDDDPYWGSQ